MNHVEKYDALTTSPSPAPSHWAASYTYRECSLHQLSPYIGKLKSIIAEELILRYSKPGQLVADMFCARSTVGIRFAERPTPARQGVRRYWCQQHPLGSAERRNPPLPDQFALG